AGSEAPLARALRGEETNEVELHVHAPDSGRIVLSVSGRPIEWEGGQLGGAVVFRDVTQRRRAEDEIREQGDKLATTNAELEHRNQEIADFSRTLSHELKTPLTSTREFVAILRDGLVGPVSERQKEYLDLAKQGCDQMTRYINDLLDLSRLETGKL